MACSAWQPALGNITANDRTSNDRNSVGDAVSGISKQLATCTHQLRSFDDYYGTDARGRTTIKDIQQYLEPGLLRGAANEASERALLDTCNALSSYWLKVTAWDHNQKVWHSFLELNQLDAAKPHSPVVVAQEQRLLTTLQSPPNPAWVAQLEALISAYNAERAGLSKSIPRQTPTTFVKRKSFCPAPTQELSDRDSPRLSAKRSASPGDYFPALAARSELEGSVVLVVDIDQNGCATQAGISVSSGVPILDEAAVTYAFEGARFMPASRDGQAVASPYEFRVSFKLQK